MKIIIEIAKGSHLLTVRTSERWSPSFGTLGHCKVLNTLLLHHLLLLLLLYLDKTEGSYDRKEKESVI